MVQPMRVTMPCAGLESHLRSVSRSQSWAAQHKSVFGLRPNSRNHQQAARASARSVLLEGPPDDYSYKEDIMPTTQSVVRSEYPELTDLVDEGSLVVWERPESYVERRSDGYQEPLQIFVIGTCHISEKSCRDVERVVASVVPENVVVELCRSRSGLMYAEPSSSEGGARPDGAAQQREDGAAAAEGRGGVAGGTGGAIASKGPFSMTGESLLAAVQRSLQLGGWAGLATRLVLSGLLSKTFPDVSMGGEMIAARRAAEACDAQVVLGDRPIEITLSRSWRSLSLQQRFALGGLLLRGLLLQDRAQHQPLLTQELAEKLKTDSIVSLLFKDLARAYPQLMQPMIHERDLYLTWSMKRSKAVNGTRRVVGVVGKGHLRGVVHCLYHDNGALRFRDLVGPRSKRGPKAWARRLAIELAAGIACFAAWEAWTTYH